MSLKKDNCNECSSLFFFIMFIGLIVLAVTCLVMSIVFSYVPSLVYPEYIVNTRVVNGTLTDFYLRCDCAKSGECRSNIRKSCNAPGFLTEPDCNLHSWYSYWYATFAYGEIECPSGYLEQFTRTENLSVNLVALASSMMILGMFICLTPLFCIWACS